MENGVAGGALPEEVKEESEIKLAEDTFTFPTVLLNALKSRTVQEADLGREITMHLLILCSVLLMMLVAGVQFFALFMVVREDIGMVPMKVDGVTFGCQQGALVIVYLAMIPDISGALQLLAFRHIFVAGGGPSRCAFAWFLSWWSGILQLMSICWCAYASAVYTYKQVTIHDIVLGAFTLTFLLQVDELVMKGLVVFFDLGKGKFLAVFTLTWKVPSSVVPEDQADVPLDKVIARKIFKKAFMLYPFLAMFAAITPTSLNYALASGTCEKKEMNNMTFITSHHFCKQAAQRMGLDRTIMKARGTCMYDHSAGKVFFDDPAKHQDNKDFVCQPRYVTISDQWQSLTTFMDGNVCARNHMLDIERPEECEEAIKYVSPQISIPGRSTAPHFEFPNPHLSGKCFLAAGTVCCRMPVD